MVRGDVIAQRRGILEVATKCFESLARVCTTLLSFVGGLSGIAHVAHKACHGLPLRFRIAIPAVHAQHIAPRVVGFVIKVDFQACVGNLSLRSGWPSVVAHHLCHSSSDAPRGGTLLFAVSGCSERQKLIVGEELTPAKVVQKGRNRLAGRKDQHYWRGRRVSSHLLYQVLILFQYRLQLGLQRFGKVPLGRISQDGGDGVVACHEYPPLPLLCPKEVVIGLCIASRSVPMACAKKLYLWSAPAERAQTLELFRGEACGTLHIDRCGSGYLRRQKEHEPPQEQPQRFVITHHYLSFLTSGSIARHRLRDSPTLHGG